MSIVSIYLILMWSVLTYTETASTATVSPAQRVTGSAVVSGRVVTNSSTTTPSPPSATPSPSWNTSLLCKHLANITSPHGSDPSPTQESLEAKCFPGFVCVNGYCTGGMSCRCNEGWAGLFCQAQCPSNCTPEGTCVTSTSNQAICMCNDTSTYEPGVGCVLRAVDDSTTTADPITTEDPKLRSKEERVCFGSMYCIHGYCDIGSMQCLCDPNWKGQLCDEPCDLNCGPHGKCRENTEYIMFCACDLGYTGDRCQTNLYKNISSTTPPTTQRQRQEENVNNMWYSLDSEPTPGTHNTTTVASTTALSENATAVNVISLNVTLINVTTDVSLTLRPLSERECLPGFVCKHGVCYRGGGGGALSCQCDPGYGGAFCDQPCQLDCGTNGSCQASDDKVFCQCLPGFDGVPCKAINISAMVAIPTDSDNIADFAVISQQSPKQQSSKSSMKFNISDVKYDWPELSGYGPLRPLELRACNPGFVCRFGNCTIENEGLLCVCEEPFTGIFCDQPCRLDCGEHGKCELDQKNQTEICYCRDSNYTGPNCTQIRPRDAEQVEFPWTGIAVALTLLLLTLMVLILLPYYLWKKRNITMMSLVHWLQPFEEDDGRQYDAFVSYASADLDRQFVIQTLVPRLEGRMCFTLCIHQRNFVPGLYITDNITDSVKKSRRTLLIISPAFISSTWCKFEYQMALQEMLTEKHRILPIILGDVSHLKHETDETLKSILKTVTWLEYPGKDASEQEIERFWKRLVLSLPKKRPGQSEPLVTPTCLISPSVSSKSDAITPLETKAPFEVRSFQHKGLRGVPLHHIVRVPASELDTASIMSDKLCVKLTKLLGKSREDDLESSQDITSSQSPLDPYYVAPPQPDPVKVDYESELTKVTASPNQVNGSLPTETTAANQDTFPASWPAAKDFESKDMSALDNYLGDQTLGRQLAV